MIPHYLTPDGERHFTDEPPQKGWRLMTEDEVAEADAPKTDAPTVLTMRQARLALLQADLLSAVDRAIERMPWPDREAAQIEWEYATEVRRDSPLIAALAPALGLDTDKLDALFAEGAQL